MKSWSITLWRFKLTRKIDFHSKENTRYTIRTITCFSIGVLEKLCKQRQNNKIIVNSKCDDDTLIESYSININTTNSDLYHI